VSPLLGIFGVLLEVATRVWPDGLDKDERLDDAWRRLYGEDRPKPPPLAIHFYEDRRILILRHGKPVEIRKLPGADGPSAVKTILERITSGVEGVADEVAGIVDRVTGGGGKKSR